MPCPHEEAQYCPLYAALHHPTLVRFGCDDGKLYEQTCAASRGLDFDAAVKALCKADPLFMVAVTLAAREAERRAQRARNMQQLGLRH